MDNYSPEPDISKYFGFIPQIQDDEIDQHGSSSVKIAEPYVNAPPQPYIKKKRVSHYIFKTPLVLFKKILMNYFKGADFLRKQVKRISREKNLSTFPKLACLCQREGVRNQILNLWISSLPEYLDHNKKIHDPEQYSQINFWSQKMTESLKCQSIEDLVVVYWGQKVRHKDKRKKCLDLVIQMKNMEY